MTDLNHVVLIGRLTQDLGSDERSFGYVGNGQARANVSIAVNRSKKQGDEWINEVFYFEVAIFGKTAENAEKYLAKGKLVGITGRIQTGSYEKDGKKYYTTEVLADRVEFLEKAGGTAQNTAPTPTPVPAGFNQLDDEDIPF